MESTHPAFITLTGPHAAGAAKPGIGLQSATSVKLSLPPEGLFCCLLHHWPLTKIQPEKLGKKTKLKKKNTQVSRKSKTSTPTTKIRCQGATLSVALGEGCHTAHALTDAIALAAATRPVTPQGHTAIWILQWRSFWNMKRLKSFTSNSSCIVLKIFRLKLWKFFKDGLSMMFSKHLLVLKLIWVGVTTSMFRAPLHTKEGCKAWTLASVPPEKSKALKKQ